MKKQPRVEIYYRTNHFTVKAPFQHLLAYAMKSGLKPLIFLDIENEVGHRQSLNSLLNLVRSQKMDIIITHSLSRFSRKADEVTAILREFEEYNVKLIIPNGQMEVAHHE